MEIPNCEVCGSSLKHIPAGISKKTGKPYNEFYACPNRECKFTWKMPNTAPKSVGNGNAIIMEELQDFRKEFNERFNGLAEFLTKVKKALDEVVGLREILKKKTNTEDGKKDSQSET